MKIMIVNDPTRKNDDWNYLAEKLNTLLTEGDLVMSIEDLHDVAWNVCGDFYIDDPKMPFYTVVPNDVKAFRGYAKANDVLLVMPNNLRDGVTGALINAFNRYNDPDNVFTF